MVAITADVDLTGPWFDGRAEAALAAFADAALEDVTNEGVNLMHTSAQVFRHPTGNWERHLQTDRAAADAAVIEDPVVYNAWLEGVSSRNDTSRFKGYKNFRLSAIRLQFMAAEIAERTLQRFLGRLQ